MTAVNFEQRLVKGRAPGSALACLIIEFVPHDLDAVTGFRARRLFLAREADRVTVTDDTGHEYLSLGHHPLFEATALATGVWSLVLRSTDRDGITHFRGLAVAYPGGHVLHDSGVTTRAPDEAAPDPDVDAVVTGFAAAAAAVREVPS